MSRENSENPYMDHQLGHYFVNLGIVMMSITEDLGGVGQ